MNKPIYKTLAVCVVAVLIAGMAVVMVWWSSKFQTVFGKKITHRPVQVETGTNVAAVLRESLTDTMEFTLDAPPGGLALQPDGKIILGTTLTGEFLDTNSGKVEFYTRGAMRLNPNGTLDRTFFCDVGQSDSASQHAKVDVTPNGEILICGLFQHVDQNPRPGYAMLQPDGKLDEAFEPWRGNTNVPGMTGLPDGVVKAAWLPDGTVGIMSESVEGSRTLLSPTAYRLDPTGRWIKPSTKVLVETFSRPSGLITTLGSVGFWARKPVEWTNNTPATPRPPIRYGSEIVTVADSPPVFDMPFENWTQKPSAAHAARVLQALFEEVPIELCRYATRLPDGGAILAIRDGVINGSMAAPGRFMRFDKNWEPDFTFTNHYEADLRSELRIKRQKDGKFLVAGLVGKMNGEDFPGLVRLDEHGQIDPGFHCTTTNSWEGRIMDLAVQDDGRIVICGFFPTVNGVEVPHIARLNPDGSLDQTFKTPFMSPKQFDRARFGKMMRGPVTQLKKPATANKSKPAIIIYPNGRVGKVKKGMNRRQVEAAIGQPLKKDTTTSFYVRKGMLVSFDTNGIVANVKIVKPFGGITQEGIGIGTSLDELMKAYGNPDEDQKNETEGEDLRFNRLKTSFSLEHGEIISIIVHLN